ncbi:MAG: 50S ribosomal protein L29 [Acidobacteriota bacterium]
MKVDRIRDMSEEELANAERDFSEQIFRLRFQMATGQMENLQKFRNLRKDLARAKTVKRERQLKAAAQGKN